MSCGVVIPGVSSSVILMIFGIYYTYLEAISILDFSILIPLGIGVVLGGILFLLIIKKLLANHFSKTFYSIIGFVLGSCFILVPSNLFCISNIFVFIIGFFIAIKFENSEIT